MNVKPRVLMLLQRYPQLSETYIKTEIEALELDHQLEIVGCQLVDLPDPEHRPFEFAPERRDVLNAVRAFKPQVLHTHYLINAATLLSFSLETGIPFTLRAHSFDTAWPEGDPMPPHFQGLADVIAHELCLGVLAFPYSIPMLEGIGVPRAKLHPAPPVVNFQLFHDRAPNTGGVMNTGAGLAKKRMEDFITVGALVPELGFDLYPLGYDMQYLADLNRTSLHPVTIHTPLPYRQMPGVYKRHRWLLYTASFGAKKVGWPMAIAEAQAAGLGVLMANIRPDLEDYLGGGGWLYDTPEEAAELLRRPYPDAMRELGFENARRCDIQAHKHLLTDLWEGVF